MSSICRLSSILSKPAASISSALGPNRGVAVSHMSGRRRLRAGNLQAMTTQFEFTLAAIAQNLRRLAKLMARPPPAVAACVA